jgi:uncharacterized membrane protein YphA (DoxX/SURF4 family)
MERVQSWLDGRRDYIFDLVRIYLGIGLFVKGIQFLLDQHFLAELLRDGDEVYRFSFLATFLAHYIPLAHIGGGALLAVGLLTRVSTLFQIPILVGAVFFVYGESGIFAHNQEFQFTSLVLFLLILILVHGGGRLSVDYLLKRRS